MKKKTDKIVDMAYEAVADIAERAATDEERRVFFLAVVLRIVDIAASLKDTTFVETLMNGVVDLMRDHGVGFAMSTSSASTEEA
jgi:DNA replication initiation complex subunit (GINS family)